MLTYIVSLATYTHSQVHHTLTDKSKMSPAKSPMEHPATRVSLVIATPLTPATLARQDYCSESHLNCNSDQQLYYC